LTEQTSHHKPNSTQLLPTYHDIYANRLWCQFF